MTEKRFQVIWECLDDSTEFQDNLTKTIFTVQDVCELLNELNDENEQLKQDKMRLIGFLHRYKDVHVEEVDELILNKENLDEWGELYYDKEDGVLDD